MLTVVGVDVKLPGCKCRQEDEEDPIEANRDDADSENNHQAPPLGPERLLNRVRRDVAGPSLLDVERDDLRRRAVLAAQDLFDDGGCIGVRRVGLAIGAPEGAEVL